MAVTLSRTCDTRERLDGVASGSAMMTGTTLAAEGVLLEVAAEGIGILLLLLLLLCVLPLLRCARRSTASRARSTAGIVGNCKGIIVATPTVAHCTCCSCVLCSKYKVEVQKVV